MALLHPRYRQGKHMSPSCFVSHCFKGFSLYDFTSFFFLEFPLSTETRLWNGEHIQLSLLITSSIYQPPQDWWPCRRHCSCVQKHFKCNPAIVSKFSDFDVCEIKIIYAICKLQMAVLMWYLPSSTRNAALLFEMLFPVVWNCCFCRSFEHNSWILNIIESTSGKLRIWNLGWKLLSLWLHFHFEFKSHCSCCWGHFVSDPTVLTHFKDDHFYSRP